MTGCISKKFEVPIIGDNVQLSSGAKIIGSVRIGDNVVVGVNVMVAKGCTF